MQLALPEKIALTLLNASLGEDSAPKRPKPLSSRPFQTFFFADHAWRAKPAVAYVGEFIDIIRKFISDAEARFQD